MDGAHGNPEHLESILLCVERIWWLGGSVMYLFCWQSILVSSYCLWQLWTLNSQLSFQGYYNRAILATVCCYLVIPVRNAEVICISGWCHAWFPDANSVLSTLKLLVQIQHITICCTTSRIEGSMPFSASMFHLLACIGILEILQDTLQRYPKNTKWNRAHDSIYFHQHLDDVWKGDKMFGMWQSRWERIALASAYVLMLWRSDELCWLYGRSWPALTKIPKVL